MNAAPTSDPLTRIGRAIGFAILAALLLWLAYRIRLVLLLLVASILVAYALEPLVHAFSGGNPRRRGLGIALAFVAVTACLVLIGMVTLGPALRQANSLQSTLTAYAQYIQGQNVTTLSNRVTPGLRPFVNKAAGELATWLSQAGAGVVRQGFLWASVLPNLVAYAGIIFSMTGLILGDKAYFKRQLFKIIPTSWQSDAELLLGEIDQALAAYVRGQLIIAAGVGFLLTIGMLLLGVRYALPLGLFAAVTQLVPVVGGVLGLIGAVIVAAFQNWWVAAEVLVLFSVMFFLSGNILGPKVMGQAVTIHPLVILIVTFAGTLLGGFAGLLLAVPVTAILRIIILFIYQRHAAEWHLGGSGPAA